MKTHDLGVSTFLLASPFTESDGAQFDYVASLGFDVIEVCIEDPSLISASWILEQASRTNLKVSICGAFGPGRDISSEDEEIRQNADAYLKKCIDIAAVVGSPLISGPMYATTGVTRLLNDVDRSSQRLRAARGLASVADYAADLGVGLAIEPLNRFETDLVNTVEQALELCDLINRQNVGLLIDTFHMNIEEKHIGGAIRTAGDRVLHVQVSENDRGTPGKGHIPWDDVFQALDDIGYKNQIVIESFLPTVKEIARAVSLWRPVAPSMHSLAVEGLAFIEKKLSRESNQS